MNSPVIRLKSERIISHLTTQLWPHHGMRFDYDISPPTALNAKRMRYTGAFKQFASNGTRLQIDVSAGSTPAGHFTVSVTVPGERMSASYYKKVLKHLSDELLTPLMEKPADFDTLASALIEPIPTETTEKE